MALAAFWPRRRARIFQAGEGNLDPAAVKFRRLREKAIIRVVFLIRLGEDGRRMRDVFRTKQGL